LLQLDEYNENTRRDLHPRIICYLSVLRRADISGMRACRICGTASADGRIRNPHTSEFDLLV